MKPILRALAVALLLPAGVSAAGEVRATIHHDIEVSLVPSAHEMTALDVVTFPAGPPDGDVRLLLHGGLRVDALDPAYVLEPDGEEAGAAVPARWYRLRPAAGAWPANASVQLGLAGAIHHPLEAEAQEYARSFSRTPGLIAPEGAVLSGATLWVPHVEDALLTFRLAVDLPGDWDAVSQGSREEHAVVEGRRRVTWACPHPMEEVYLIAAPFTEYARPAGDVVAQAFLRTPDPALAAKYLEATAQYLEMYRRLIGPYPFAKFALVENFWETGYGMPSFTLLGPKIIRFPFILHSSYPHEILHNWWGNSVYVEWQTGNWCEGLTAYLADHLIKEGQGQGEAYRRDTLKKFRDYAGSGRDFPLTEFRSRHSSATEAVGYGKSAMLFHMLRVRLGDATFAKGLQAFYRRNRFRAASFTDVAEAFSDVAGEDLRPFVRQWTERPGAPALAVEATPDGGGIVVRQVQEGEPWALDVPIAVTVEGEPEARLVSLEMKGAEAEMRLPAGAVRVDVDCSFDLFRVLDRSEIPPTLGEVFGAERVTIVLPEDAGAWRDFAESWRSEQVEIVAEDGITSLPADRAVWVLGRANRWASRVTDHLARRGQGVEGDEVVVGEARYPLGGTSFVFVAPHPGNGELAIGWIASDLDAALPGLGRKLPHYGKYSYLAFTGDEPANVAKGQWEASDSPLVLHPEVRRGALPRREPLARLAPVFDPERLMAHVRTLAADEMRGRGIGKPELDRAADCIAKAFEEAGLQPGGDDGGWFQTWAEIHEDAKRPMTLRNVVAVLPGREETWEGQSVVVGAHYDHLGLGWPDVRAGNEGLIHNGADDNASGVAVLLEVAALLTRTHTPRRALVFVAFSGEEWDRKGSRHYVRAMERWPASKCLGMVNLDTVGRLEGRKLTLLGSGTATEWKHIAMGVGYTTGVEAVCIPQDPGGSDQVSFHDAGVPAIQLFSGMHADYHRPTDDIEKVEPDSLVKVATFVREAVVYLSEREEPLTATPGGGQEAPAQPAGGGRRVSLGTMPDFAFPGPGVKVNDVIDGSPARAAGIAPGDILLAIGDTELKSLRDFSEALKTHQPGDRIAIRLRRGEEERTVEATLVAR